jgi:hypothetical protein
MESFGLNSAKSFLGRNVNLHLKDGSVIINVRLTSLRKDDYRKGNFVEYITCKNQKQACLPLNNIAWAELLNMSLMQASN